MAPRVAEPVQVKQEQKIEDVAAQTWEAELVGVETQAPRPVVSAPMEMYVDSNNLDIPAFLRPQSTFWIRSNMDQQALEKVCEKVSKNFPGDGKEEAESKALMKATLFLLIFGFQGQNCCMANQCLVLVRVIANPNGKVIKMTTSR